MNSIQEIFFKGKSFLKNYSHPDLEAKLLLFKSASISEEEFYSESDRKLSRTQERLFHRLLAKRLAGFPLAYLTGTKEFWSISFKVFPGILIPRPETELLVERVIELSSQNEQVILDIGTGSGNIAVSLAKELPNARIIATDISKKALRTARMNASLQGIPNLTFITGDLFNPLRKLGLEEKCDFIVSNPPYVSKREWKMLSQEIKSHEPKKALVAGETGLEVIQMLIQRAPNYLKPGGYLIFEIGAGQKDEVLKHFRNDWDEVRCFDDLSGIPRIFSACKTISV